MIGISRQLASLYPKPDPYLWLHSLNPLCYTQARVKAFYELTERMRDVPQADTRIDFGANSMVRQGAHLLAWLWAHKRMRGTSVLCLDSAMCPTVRTDLFYTNTRNNTLFVLCVSARRDSFSHFHLHAQATRSSVCPKLGLRWAVAT